MPTVIRDGLGMPGNVFSAFAQKIILASSRPQFMELFFEKPAVLDNNKLSSEFCDIRLEWGDITPRQEYGVRVKYAEDCYDGEIRVHNQFQDQWP